MSLVVYQAALADFLRPRRLFAWGLVLVGLYAGARAWLSAQDTMALDMAYGQMSTVLVFRILALASAIFATSVLSGEVEQKTIVYLVTRPIPRWQLLLSRVAAAMTVVFAISALGAVVTSLAVYGGDLLQNRLLVGDLGTLALGTIAYGGLFVLISLWANRAMLICLLFAFGWESSVPNMPGELYYLSIFSYLSALAKHPVGETRGPLGALSGQLGVNTLSASTAFVVLVIFCIAVLAFGAWWFSRFEYLPREDAE